MVAVKPSVILVLGGLSESRDFYRTDGFFFDSDKQLVTPFPWKLGGKMREFHCNLNQSYFTRGGQVVALLENRQRDIFFAVIPVENFDSTEINVIEDGQEFTRRKEEELRELAALMS